jgi:biopolymer transport protein ExbD
MRLVFLLGVFLLSTLLSLGQTAKTTTTTTSVQSQQKKDQQHVKVMVSQNGKVTKIDTTFNLPNEKLVQLKVDSLLKILEGADGKSGEANIIIMRGDDNIHMGKHGKGNSPGERQITVYYQKSDSSDAVGHKKVMMIGNGKGLVTFDGDGEMMPPPPPPPPPPHGMTNAIRVQGFKLPGGDPFAMDPSDPDIITYDKKDIGKGLEKITIVRKKRTSPEIERDVQVKVEVSDDKKK